MKSFLFPYALYKAMEIASKRSSNEVSAQEKVDEEVSRKLPNIFSFFPCVPCSFNLLRT